MSQFYTSTDHFVLLPALMLALFGCAVLLLDFLVFRAPAQRKWLLGLTLAGLTFTGIALFRQHQFFHSSGLERIAAFQGALVVDQFSLFFNWIFLASAALIALASFRFFELQRGALGEYYGLLLLAHCGMFFLASAMELITLLVGLELMAIPFYILVGFSRESVRSNEAAMKYLLLGAFSTGFLIYGFSLLYGIAGATNLTEVARALGVRGRSDPVVLLAFITTAVGLLFKIAAVPFHMWAPDAYEGAPTPVTGYLSVASKAAAFAFLLRIFLGPFDYLRPVWEPMFVAVAAATLTLGNLAALTQSNVKRMLAYSSIAHAGYMLLGLIAGNATGIKGVAVYILVYTFMNAGAFIVLALLRRESGFSENLDDLAGLGRKHPVHAIWMLVFLISLAGLPPTAGFIGKYYIFLSLVEAERYVLAVIAVLYVAVSVYFYFRIVRAMFFTAETSAATAVPDPANRLALGLSGVATLLIGLYPEPFLRFAEVLSGR